MRVEFDGYCNGCWVPALILDSSPVDAMRSVASCVNLPGCSVW